MNTKEREKFSIKAIYSMAAYSNSVQTAVIAVHALEYSIRLARSKIQNYLKN